MHMVEEHDLTGADGGMVHVRVLADNGDGTSRIEVRDCGIRVRAGQQYDIPTGVIVRR